MTTVGTLQLEALAQPTRRAVFDLVRTSPSSVRELADRLPISQPAVSQHLKVLHAAELVECRALGARHVYRVDPRGLEELRTWISSLWDDVLEAFLDAAESEVTETTGDA